MADLIEFRIDRDQDFFIFDDQIGKKPRVSKRTGHVVLYAGYSDSTKWYSDTPSVELAGPNTENVLDRWKGTVEMVSPPFERSIARPDRGARTLRLLADRIRELESAPPRRSGPGATTEAASKLLAELKPSDAEVLEDLGEQGRVSVEALLRGRESGQVVALCVLLGSAGAAWFDGGFLRPTPVTAEALRMLSANDG